MNRSDAIAEEAKPAKSAIDPIAKFPGRVRLFCSEVSRALQITDAQVFDLIGRGELEATDYEGAPFGARQLPRNCWRVPIASLAAFVAKSSTSTLSE